MNVLQFSLFSLAHLQANLAYGLPQFAVPYVRMKKGNNSVLIKMNFPQDGFHFGKLLDIILLHIYIWGKMLFKKNWAQCAVCSTKYVYWMNVVASVVRMKFSRRAGENFRDFDSNRTRLAILYTSKSSQYNCRMSLIFISYNFSYLHR